VTLAVVWACAAVAITPAAMVPVTNSRLFSMVLSPVARTPYFLAAMLRQK